MSWAEFFSMDGKGLFVWGSFGAFLFCIAVEIILVRLRIGRAQARIRHSIAADAATASASQPEGA